MFVAGEVKRPFQVDSVDGQRCQAARLDILSHGNSRKDGNTDASFDRLDDGLGAAHNRGDI